MPESPRAYEILRRLQDASIDAQLTTEWGPVGLHLGGSPMASIWIADDADKLAAMEIVASVEDAPLEQTRCPQCGYDLRGHGGEVACPECGSSIPRSAIEPPHEVPPEYLAFRWRTRPPRRT